jgi:hypothetical protein
MLPSSATAQRARIAEEMQQLCEEERRFQAWI